MTTIQGALTTTDPAKFDVNKAGEVANNNASPVAGSTAMMTLKVALEAPMAVGNFPLRAPVFNGQPEQAAKNSQNDEGRPAGEKEGKSKIKVSDNPQKELRKALEEELEGEQEEQLSKIDWNEIPKEKAKKLLAALEKGADADAIFEKVKKAAKSEKAAAAEEEEEEGSSK